MQENGWWCGGPDLLACLAGVLLGCMAESHTRFVSHQRFLQSHRMEHTGISLPILPAEYRIQNRFTLTIKLRLEQSKACRSSPVNQHPP